MERGANPTLAALAEQTLIQHPPFSMSDLTARNAKHALWAQGTAAYSAFTLHHSSLLSGLCVFSLCALCGKNASSFSSTELTARNAKHAQGAQGTAAHSAFIPHHSALPKMGADKRIALIHHSPFIIQHYSLLVYQKNFPPVCKDRWCTAYSLTNNAS